MAARQWPAPGIYGGFVNEDGTEEYTVPFGFFGENTVSVQTLSPSGIASAEAFGTPTFVPGAVTISPTGIASAEAFGTAAFVLGAVTLTPSGIASAEAIGTPIVTGGASTSYRSVVLQGININEGFGYK